MFRSGQYRETPQTPARLGYVELGIIEQIGTVVKGYERGDAVRVVPSFSMNTSGVYGNATNVPASALAHHPETLSWTEPAAVWTAYAAA